MTYKIITLILMINFSLSIQAQKRPHIFYLAIGSGNYATDDLEEGAKGYWNIISAPYSAYLIDSVLSTYTNSFGIKLVSTDSTAISNQDIDSALKIIETNVKKDASNASNDLIVFYYAGHGIKHRDSHDLFLVPNYFSNNLNYLMGSQFRTMAYSFTNIYYRLKQLHVSVVMMMDCCFNETTDDLKQTLIDSIISIPKIPIPSPDLEFYAPRNGYTIELGKSKHPAKRCLNPENDLLLSKIEDEDAAFFAAKPGYYAKSVSAPTTPDKNVAPLCRRTVLLAERSAQLDIDQWMDTFTNKDFEKDASPVSYYIKPQHKYKIVLPKKA